MNTNNQTINQKLIKQFYNLFFTAKYKYLIMYPNGRYVTYNKYDNKDNFKPLTYWQIENHINNKFTLGVFASNYLTKFICFDIDVQDPVHAKWVTYYLYDTLIDIGIPRNYIHISTSGNKGYHIDIYFNEVIQNALVKDFYDIVMSNMDTGLVNGEIELRPTNQGLKLPLGTNFKNKNSFTNKCWYVSYEKELKPIRNYEYILNIEQLETNVISNIIEDQKDILVIHNNTDTKDAEQIEEDKGYIDSKYNSLSAYKKYVDANMTVEYMEKLEFNGLQQAGTRHNSLFNLCRYYKYLGQNEQENENNLILWMNEQDTRTYTTPMKECYTDINRIVTYIYKNDIGLINRKKDIYINYNEMLYIMKNFKSKNEKLVSYCMLLHSKNYKDGKGVFYMSFPQLQKSSGLGLRTVKRIVPQLEGVFIDYIERNVMIKNNKGQFITKKPNKYKIVFEVDGHDKQFKINDDNISTYNEIVKLFFSNDDLRGLLSKRQYYTLIND